MNEWLKTYHFKTTIMVWDFFFVALIALLITVSFQAV